jgi:hypothetical protein
MTQFRRLLEKIAEENQKVFQGKALSVYTINKPEGCQMGKLREIGKETQESDTFRPLKGRPVQRTLQVNSN